MMRVVFAPRRLTAVAFLAVIVAASAIPARAASVLSNIAISALGQGARVTISFSGGVPQGWRIDGNGSGDIIVRLPGAQQSTSLNQLSYPGRNNVTGVSIGNSGAEIDIDIHVAGHATARYAASYNGIVLDIPPSNPNDIATPAPVPTSGAPVSGGATAFGGDANSVTQVIPLRYADVSEIAGVLGDVGTTVPSNDTFSPSGSIFSLPTQNGPLGTQPQPGGLNQQNQPQSIGQRVNAHIAVDRRLNAVVVTGSQAEVDAMRALISQIDVPITSVMLECEVVELSTNGQKDLGIDYATGPNGPVGQGSGSFGTLNNAANGGLGNIPIFGATFNAKLFATVQSGGGRILASPRILAQNGVPAQILTGDALPIITTTTFPGPPLTTQQTVNYIAVGVNLQIQPRIAENGDVTSHVFAEVSSVTAEIATPQGNVPQISLRQASTTATVHDGQSFVIGGLLKDEEIKNLERVPGLSSIPIIGALFKVQHETHQISNLYVIITPHVITPTLYEAPPTKPRLQGPTPAPHPTP